MINGFFGQYRFLSNFTPCTILYDGIIYPSVEHAYVAAKTLDQNIRAQIARTPSPSEAKKLGRVLILRNHWDDIKLDIMYELLLQKFSKPYFSALLLSTGDHYLEETNTWNDTFWGVCNDVGSNHLGNFLMNLRDGLKLL